MCIFICEYHIDFVYIIYVCVSYIVSMVHVCIHTYIYHIYGMLWHTFQESRKQIFTIATNFIPRKPFDSPGPQFPHLKSEVIRPHTLKHILALIACYYLDNEETHWVEERLLNCGSLLSRKGPADSVHKLPLEIHKEPNVKMES